ncbi:transcription factor MYC HLH domain-containing protein [Chloropicon primus]|uniref:Transcription factor MYC/MYB N-terminal domain-containing protein n=1 Tax=Chloropicon primus TaxID=1764295 RepID=A0A5B8ME48_9CHLO|nr:hypothetical protein A3770_02p14160 [Chloropicon primus]UPQ98106.1 transcription factor MYC HLH domain-containing protein [Chloropicon primus]|eukprot:QDZ18898.1 hypothetical protein A3770_02p14160 [Chloropicon primus]
MEVTHSAFTIAQATETKSEEDCEDWDNWSTERESDSATSHGGVDESHESFSNTVDSLLQESLNSFLDEGPILHPIEHQYSELKGGNSSFSSNPQSTRDFVADCLSLVCECKGFEYSIVWEIDNKLGLLTAKTGYYIPGCGKIKTFYNSSMTLRAFPLGLEIPGRVAYSGQVEWCDHVHEEAVCRFHRVNEAKMYGVQTVLGIPIACGVLEFGSSQKIPQCPQILRYIHNVCKPLLYCLQDSTW